MFKTLFRRNNDNWTSDKINKLINAYGEHLELHGGVIEDQSKLPFPKMDIKRAILLAISFSNDLEDRKLLSSSYLKLADFQSFTITELEAVKAHNNALSIQPTSDNLDQIARGIRSSAKTYQELLNRARAETEALQLELRTLSRPAQINDDN